jgi:hypothetical protein
MLGVIRLSPSGPPITNEGGGQAEPGPGFQLRLSEAAGSTAMAALTDAYQNVLNIAGDPYEVELTAPDPAKRYKVNFHCDVDQVTSADSAVQFRLMAAYDGSTFDKQLGENTHQLLADSERRAGIDVAMILGSSLGFPLLAPLPAAAPSIKVRVQAKATATGTVQIPNGGSSGSIWLSLAELL